MELDRYRHYFYPRLESIDLFEPLLDMADRFSCTMEMATYLTMLSVGGPKRFFRWYYDASSWKVTGTKSIPSNFKQSFLLCNDDLEFALLLMRTWFQSGSTYEERERWAKKWQVNQNALIYAVEHKRDHLLADRFYEQKAKEYVRPVDLRLIPKVRLLIAYYLVNIARLRKNQEKGLAVNGDIYRASAGVQPPVHQDSVLYGRDNRGLKNFVYFFPDQEREVKRIEAQQLICISLDWLNWLLETRRDEYDLALYITQKTRYVDDIQLPSQLDIAQKARGQRRWNNQDTFLGQNVVSMLESFAIEEHRNGEGISMKPYYNSKDRGGVCGIAEPPVSKELERLQKNEILAGKITAISSNFSQVHLKLSNGLSGVLYQSGMWGQWNDSSDDEHISMNKIIPVRIKFINKQTGYIEVDARLPGLNPLEKFYMGQEVEGIIEQVGESPQTFILVRIHPRVKPVQCRIHESYGTDIRKRYKVGDIVTCRIKDLHPEKEHIHLELVEKNSPDTNTDKPE